MNDGLREELAATLSKHGYSTTQLVWLESFATLLDADGGSVDRGALLRAALRQPSLLHQNPETLARNVKGSAARLGVSVSQFTSAAFRHPPLFHQKPETLAANVQGSSACLSVSVAQFTSVALKHPSLFGHKPETLAANVEGSAARLGVSVAQFTSAALKRPQLFSLKPETLAANVEGSAARLGVSIEQFTMAALKQPQLFYQNPSTLAANVEGSAARVGISVAQFTMAAFKQPVLFYQRPETLAANVEGSAARLGVSVAQFSAAALKQPNLFCRKPETLAQRMGYAVAVARRVGVDASSETILRKTPVAVMYSSDRLHARYILAALGMAPESLAGTLNLPPAETERRLVAFYTNRMRSCGKGARTLQVLHAKGIIQKLPDGIDPIAHPPKRGDGFGHNVRSLVA